MITIEDEHHLSFGPKIVRTPDGEYPTHTTDHGFCTCGLEIWSRYGREEIKVLHQRHLELERDRAAKVQADAVGREVRKHRLRFNALGDFGTCEAPGCQWSLATSSTAKMVTAHSEHLMEVERTCT